MKRFFLPFIAICCFNTSFSQNVMYNNIFDKSIKTVLMYQDNDELSWPVWDLGSSKYLTLSFDDLDANTKDYNYKIIHCKSDISI